VFYDTIDFCHPIELRGRLENSYPTIPLADLVLHKTQIVELAPKDVIDLQMVLHEFDFSSSDKDAISIPRIAVLCGSNWGLYHTTGISIDKSTAATHSATYLNANQKTRILGQLAQFQQILEDAPKSLRWRARAFIGERVRWYETVDRDEVPS
jgi:hypothetical protein